MKILEIYNELEEEYPSSWNLEEFIKLGSFAKRSAYCRQHLIRLSSGSGREVYKIDEEKVLKLAKNKKGVAQNELEIELSSYEDLKPIVARTFHYDNNGLWVEMELAKRIGKSIFKRITGFEWRDYVMVMHNHYGEITSKGKYRPIFGVDRETLEAMWDNDFIYRMLTLMEEYSIPVGDLIRLNSYGLVKRNGVDTIVLVDYGLNDEVYDTHYKRKSNRIW